jgi:hypothetical protein
MIAAEEMPQVVGNVTQVRVRHRLALVAAIRSGSKKRISEASREV